MIFIDRLTRVIIVFVVVVQGRHFNFKIGLPNFLFGHIFLSTSHSYNNKNLNVGMTLLESYLTIRDDNKSAKRKYQIIKETAI
jgi:hypothetical protein